VFGLGRKDRLATRLERVEDELSAIKRHLDDVEDTLTHRVGKLMARAKRGAQEESPPEAPLGGPEYPAPDQSHPYPSLAALRRKMRGF